MNSKGLKEKLNKMSDMELYTLIHTVALASGLDGAKAQALTSDIPRLRRMLSSLSDEQIATMLSSIGRNVDINKLFGGN
jgi:hypothetical protein